VTSYDKEKPSRITSDAKDRDKIRKCLTCIASLGPYNHPADLVSVVTGLISPEMVNAHDAVDNGNGQLVSSFEKSWPDGFTLLSKLVLTMAVKRKVAKFGNNDEDDTNLIYSLVL